MDTPTTGSTPSNETDSLHRAIVEHHESGNLHRAIERLDQLTSEMGVCSMLILGATLLSIAVLIIFPLLGSGSPRATLLAAHATAAGVTMSAVIALVSLAFFEQSRREGTTLFEEVSDELQWRVASFRSNALSSGELPNAVAAREKPGIGSRLVLRGFTRASDLPLVPGTFGPAAYAIMNVFLIILSFVLPKYLV